MATVCHHCRHRESDPRRLIKIAYPFTPRHSTARCLSTHVTHVDCFLRAGGTIAGLADSQLWHVPAATWQRLGYLPGDSRAEYARVQEEERMAATHRHVVLSEAEGPHRRRPQAHSLAGGDEILRCAQDDMKERAGGPSPAAPDPSACDDAGTSPRDEARSLRELRQKRVGRREERAAATTRDLRRAA